MQRSLFLIYSPHESGSWVFCLILGISATGCMIWKWFMLLLKQEKKEQENKNAFASYLPCSYLSGLLYEVMFIISLKP